jgi:hypothetical protein
MIIYINENPINVSYYDDKIFIVKRYILGKKISLPKYFRIENEDVFIKEEVSLKIIDVRDEFRWLELNDLIDEEVVEEIINLYPYLSKKDIALIIIYNKYPEINWGRKISDINIINDITFLKKIDGFVFFNNIETMKILEEYPINIQKKIKIIQSEIDLRDEINSIFSKYKPTPLENFLIEELNILYILEIKTEWSLIDIFDLMEVSKDIPFIYFRPEVVTDKKERNYYKVYDLIDGITEWINPNQYVSGRLYFRVLNPNNSPIKNLNENYNKAEWFSDNTIEVKFKIETNKENDKIKMNIHKSIGNRLKYKIIKEKQIGVKGIYSVDNFSFNKAVLADMISNSYIFSYFLFFNENTSDNKSKFKTAITKERFMFHYEPNQKGPSDCSLSITITPQFIEEEKKNWLDIRIRKASNIHQIESFKFVFSLLLSIYNNNEKSVIREYGELLPSTKEEFEMFYIKIKKMIKKDDKKSGKRLMELKKFRPGVFRAGYASMCQPKKTQPYVLDPENVEKFREEYGEHKMMEFEDPSNKKKDWYACEPREDGELPIYIYPGLRKNNIKSKNYNSEVPFVPCCFGENQYTKTGAELYKRTTSTNTSPKSDDNIIGEIGHILSTNKHVPPGRYGVLPFYLTFIAKKSGYQHFEKGKQTIVPIFRYGVEISPDSFLHCMEKAFNPDYSMKDLKGKKELVNKVRIDMSNMNFSSGRQELYDHSDDMIKNILLDKNKYLDPRIWHSLVETKYGCNIFIYKISDEHPNGTIVIPRFSQIYLSKHIFPDKPTIFIVKKMPDAINVDCQTEILVRYNHKAKGNKRFKFVFQNDIFITQAIKMFYESINIFVINPESSHNYKPINTKSKLFEGVLSQYIDSYGKSRMLTYDNDICLMTPPLPPFDKKENLKLHVTNANLDIVLDFVKSKNLTITSQYGNEITKIIKGLWVKSKKLKTDGLIYGYIPINEENEIHNINYSSKYLYNLLEVEDSSSLELYRSLRKKAFFLKEYTLFQYTTNLKILDSDDFVIKPNHIYNIKSLNKLLIPNNPVIYQNGKIIVTTEKTRDNLINFLKISLSTNYEKVMSYSNRTIVNDFYKNVSDFRKVKNQLVFNDVDTLYSWNLTKSSLNNINVIKTGQDETEIEINPYYYRNYKVNEGKIAIAQQVRDFSLKNLLNISNIWDNERKNVGYSGNETFNVREIDPKNESYIVYTPEGKSKIINPGLLDVQDKEQRIPSLLKLNCKKDESENYLSLLFL